MPKSSNINQSGIMKDTQTGLEAIREDMDKRFQDEIGGNFSAKIEFDSDAFF